MLEYPPELERRHRGARAIDHWHTAVQIGNLIRILILPNLYGRQEESARLVHPEKLVSADCDGVKGMYFAVYRIPILCEG